jgi:hypothetical protein
MVRSSSLVFSTLKSCLPVKLINCNRAMEDLGTRLAMEVPFCSTSFSTLHADVPHVMNTIALTMALVSPISSLVGGLKSLGPKNNFS